MTSDEIIRAFEEIVKKEGYPNILSFLLDTTEERNKTLADPVLSEQLIEDSKWMVEEIAKIASPSKKEMNTSSIKPERKTYRLYVNFESKNYTSKKHYIDVCKVNSGRYDIINENMTSDRENLCIDYTCVNNKCEIINEVTDYYSAITGIRYDETEIQLPSAYQHFCLSPSVKKLEKALKHVVFTVIDWSDV